jgi:hypothetical protein
MLFYLTSSMATVYSSDFVLLVERRNGRPFRDGRTVRVLRSGHVFNVPGRRYYGLRTGRETVDVKIMDALSRDGFPTILDIVCQVRVQFADEDAPHVLSIWKERGLEAFSSPKPAWLASLEPDDRVAELARPVLVEAARLVCARWMFKLLSANRAAFSGEVTAEAGRRMAPLGVEPCITVLKDLHDGVGYYEWLGIMSTSGQQARKFLAEHYREQAALPQEDRRRPMEPGEILLTVQDISERAWALLDDYKQYTPESWERTLAALKELENEKRRLFEEAAANRRFPDDKRELVLELLDLRDEMVRIWVMVESEGDPRQNPRIKAIEKRLDEIWAILVPSGDGKYPASQL